MPRSRPTAPVPAAVLASALALLTAGCLGDDNTGPEPEPRLASVEVTPDSAELSAIGATQQYTAEALDQFGDPFPDVEIQWSSEDPSIVEVDSTGLATARDSGRALVQATADGLGDVGVARVTFVRDEAAEMEALSGGGQHGTTLHPYPDSLVVEVRRDDGEPARGAIVEFRVTEGTGSVSPGEATTGVDGRAMTRLTAGETTGPVTVEARAGDADPVTFHVTTTVLYVEILDDVFVDPRGRTNTAASAEIQLGRDTVLFEYSGGSTQHTVTSGEGTGGGEGDGLPEGAGEGMDSGLLDPGDTYRFVPGTAGTWTYYCEVHPDRMYDAEIVVREP